MTNSAELLSAQTDHNFETPEEIFNHLLQEYNGTNLPNPKATGEITTTKLPSRYSRNPELALDEFRATGRFNTNGSSFNIFTNDTNQEYVLHSPRGFTTAKGFFQEVFNQSHMSKVPDIQTDSERHRPLFFQIPESQVFVLQIHEEGSYRYFQEPTYIIDLEQERLMFSRIPMLRFDCAPKIKTTDIQISPLPEVPEDPGIEDRYANEAMRIANEY